MAKHRHNIVWDEPCNECGYIVGYCVKCDEVLDKSGAVPKIKKQNLSFANIIENLRVEIADRKDCERSLTKWNEELSQKVKELEAFIDRYFSKQEGVKYSRIIELEQENMRNMAKAERYEKLLKDLTEAVRAYADIGRKQFNEDEDEFWKMCEVNDNVEQALGGK